MLLTVALLLGGCSEAMQKKFIRKRKTPEAKPSPVVQFEDYSRMITPLDRYRKHYALFEYWNSEVLDSLVAPTMNPKRLRHASSEALNELQILQRLVMEPAATKAAEFLQERERLHRQIQNDQYHFSQRSLLRQSLELQTRDIHRTLYWRKVDSQLKPLESMPVKPAQAEAPAQAATAESATESPAL